MKKLGRQYEEAVHAFAKTLDSAAEVLFNHSVTDRDTGTPRQCDVWINAKFGGHWPLSILVSCKDHRRKLHVGDIGTFLDEIRSTGASTGIIYSRKGYTKPAVDKAKANGVSCCRIYQNEPGDMPFAIWFDFFACTPTIQILTETDLRNTAYQTWNDLFDITILDNKIALDAIADAFSKGEEWSLSGYQKESSRKAGLFPSNWCAELKLREANRGKDINLSIIGRWRRYRSRVEAVILNGSYCVSNGSFKGELAGPVIDTQGEFPGDAWTEISDPNFTMPLNKVVTILSKSNVKELLREKLGPQSIIKDI